MGALRASLLCAPLVCGWLVCALPMAHALPAQTLPVLKSGIAPQALSSALAALIRQSSLQIIYVSSLAAGKQSPGAHAGVTVPAALTELLEGTGLRFEYLNDHTVRLVHAPDHAPARAAGGAPAAQRAAQTLPADTFPEEILVTATKRETTLSVLPMSARVLSAEDMSASGIHGVSGISLVTPGTQYAFNPQFHPGIYTDLAIRGIVAGKGNPTTGIYLDDTPIQMPYSSISYVYPVTFDLTRVEVLRGPQGVLFGRGAEGGAVRFITHEPSTTQSDVLVHSEVDATERAGITVEAGAAAGAPLIAGRLGARFSAWYRGEGGYVDRVNPFNGATIDPNANRSWIEAFRLGLLYEPADAWRITTTLSYQAAHAHDTPVFYGYLSAPGEGVLRNGKLLRQPSLDSDFVGAVRLDGRIGAAGLTAVTSYVERRANATYDETNEDGAVSGGYGNPLGDEFPSSYADAIAQVLGVHQRLLVEELRLASPESVGRLSWLAGLYCSRLRQNFTENDYLTATLNEPATIGDSDLTQTELAAFGQADLALGARWKLGAGLRLGAARGEGDFRSGGYATAASYSRPGGTGWKSAPVLPRYSLSYQADSGDFYYLSAARGFRGGGNNGTPPVPCGNAVLPAAYGPDEVWSYEAGARVGFLDQWLQLNASVYDVHWNDVQLHLYDPCGDGYTTNQGAAVSRGFDLEARARLTARVRLSLVLGYDELYFTRTQSLATGQVIAVRGTSGGVPDVPPPWSGTLTAEYRWPIRADVSAYLRAENIVDSHNPGPFTEQNPNYVYYDARIRSDPAISLINLRLGLTTPNVEINLFVENASDRQPVLQLYADAPGSQLLYAYTLRPRTVGLSGTWRH